MKNKSHVFLIVNILAFFGFTLAHSEVVYKEKIQSGPPSAFVFKIPYSLGTHTGESNAWSAQLKMKPGDFSTLSGEVKILLTSFNADQEKLQCHMLSSLGLDYTVSDFPKSHVCDDDNKLPSEGVNSLKYNEITFQVIHLKVLKSFSEKSYEIEVKGKVKLHGVEKEEVIIGKLEVNDSGFNFTGDHTFKLNDYGIVVKKFLFISVSEKFTMKFNLNFDRDTNS